jgi:hypothetical protein
VHRQHYKLELLLGPPLRPSRLHPRVSCGVVGPFVHILRATLPIERREPQSKGDHLNDWAEPLRGGEVWMPGCDVYGPSIYPARLRMPQIIVGQRKQEDELLEPPEAYAC